MHTFNIRVPLKVLSSLFEIHYAFVLLYFYVIMVFGVSVFNLLSFLNTSI